MGKRCAEATVRLKDTGITQHVNSSRYENIEITGCDSPLQLKKYKVKHGSRLRLLRRTLRDRTLVANLVKEIRVPDPGFPPFLSAGKPNPRFCEYRDLVASLVMACPNLERLLGFHCLYNHEFDRLTQALSTRRKLKEHVWIVGENESVTERSHHQLPPGLLDQHQVYQFLHYHRSWSHLETLMLYSPGGAGIIEHELFVRVFQLLPSLKRLCISSFDGDDFSDETLLAIPPVTSLRLEQCPGISDRGLSRWASNPSASALETLSLVSQRLTSLLSVAKLLASLPTLLKFTLVQADTILSVPTDLMILQPILASKSLRHLHWDVVAPPGISLPGSGTESNIKTPNGHLALSIINSGFPSLETLRSPQDLSPIGALQAVCRPAKNGQVLLPADRYSLPPQSRGPNASMPSALPLGNSLHEARIRAQSYIETASKNEKEFMKVIVTDYSQCEIGRDGRESTSSSSYSRASTDPTDPGDLFSLDGDLGGSIGMAVSSDLFPKSLPPANPALIDTPLWPLPLFSPPVDSDTLPDPFPQGPASAPLKVQEFSLPSFVGRVATAGCAQPPKFHLLPDVYGNDHDGGVIGWSSLLGVKEKSEKVAAVANGSTFIKDGCTGAWNKGDGTGKGPDWWKHTERERRRVGTKVTVNHFF